MAPAYPRSQVLLVIIDDDRLASKRAPKLVCGTAGGLLMPVSIVRLGSPRKPDEGLRLGTVRRPPRGVPKTQWAKLDYCDLWFPLLSPSQGLVALALSAEDDKSWKAFERKFTAEMSAPEPARVLDLLAAFSEMTNFSVGCYCEREERCHRSILRTLLSKRCAAFA